MSYWRICKIGDRVFPIAVGTVDVHSGFEFPPSDGGWFTDEELPAALEAAGYKRPKPIFPWQRPLPAPLQHPNRGGAE